MKSRRSLLLVGLPLLLVFGCATALAFWTPTRIQSGASPYEWTAFYSYLAALLGVSLCTFFDVSATLRTLWLAFLIDAFFSCNGGYCDDVRMATAQIRDI